MRGPLSAPIKHWNEKAAFLNSRASGMQSGGGRQQSWWLLRRGMRLAWNKLLWIDICAAAQSGGINGRRNDGWLNEQIHESMDREVLFPFYFSRKYAGSGLLHLCRYRFLMQICGQLSVHSVRCFPSGPVLELWYFSPLFCLIVQWWNGHLAHIQINQQFNAMVTKLARTIWRLGQSHI